MNPGNWPTTCDSKAIMSRAQMSVCRRCVNDAGNEAVSFSVWWAIQNPVDELLFPGRVSLTIVLMLFGKKGFQIGIGAN